MAEVTLKVSNSELNSLENLIVAWNLCEKHNSIHNATEEERFKFTQTCKKCIKINREIRNKALHLWSKLVTSYEKQRKRK